MVGGVHGSPLSTSLIINLPQSAAIHGMQLIVSHPMVVAGNIIPRPRIYNIPLT
ncbi:hypothetical protein Sjap_025986 [Stephania japonica]|uniref:Uncharacterized protein n=1 Tax=Stephania japonica TaxID=461633 RepID=A0AAP0E2N9_9MAGN